MAPNRTLLSCSAAVAFAVAVTLASGCREKTEQVEPVEQMVARVKPAVTRVVSSASARASYPSSVVAAVREEMTERGYQAGSAPVTQRGSLSLETGAGGSASGFIIDESGVVVTSAHAVSQTLAGHREDLRNQLLRNGAVTALMRFIPVEALRAAVRDDALEQLIDEVAERGRLSEIRITNEVELSNGERHPYTIARYSSPAPEGGRDLAVLQINRRGLPTVALGGSEQLHVQQPVWVFGYPAVASSRDELIGGWLSADSDLEATVNPGTITALRKDTRGRQLLQTNAAVYQGNSGGPAVDQRGRVVGIASWGHSEAEQIKFLIPVEALRALITERPLPIGRRSPFDLAYGRALAAVQARRWSNAAEAIAIAKRAFRNSPDVMRLETEIATAVVALPWWRRNEFATAALAALLVCVLIAVLGRQLYAGRRTPARAEVVIVPSSRHAATPEGSATEMSSRNFRDSLLGKLTILNGEHAGDRFGLGGSGIRIGRESTVCEIVLENPKVSRLHAEVVAVDGRVLLIDRNSSNGTYVNDRKIERTYLADGDIIYFGGRNAVAVAYHA